MEEHRGLSLEATADRIGEYLRENGLGDGYTHALLAALSAVNLPISSQS